MSSFGRLGWVWAFPDSDLCSVLEDESVFTSIFEADSTFISLFEDTSTFEEDSDLFSSLVVNARAGDDEDEGFVSLALLSSLLLLDFLSFSSLLEEDLPSDFLSSALLEEDVEDLEELSDLFPLLGLPSLLDDLDPSPLWSDFRDDPLFDSPRGLAKLAARPSSPTMGFDEELFMELDSFGVTIVLGSILLNAWLLLLESDLLDLVVDPLGSFGVLVELEVVLGLGFRGFCVTIFFKLLVHREQYQTNLGSLTSSSVTGGLWHS